MAEAPVISCPECHKKFKSKADVGGKKIRCPFCKEVIVAAGAVASTAIQAKGKGVAVPSKADDPDAPIPVLGLSKPAENEEENDNPYGVTHLDLSPRCPNCANEMESADAIVCLHCGYNTMTREWGKTEKTIATSGGRHFLHLLPAILAILFVIFQTASMLYYCLVMPYHVAGTFMAWTDHESMRMYTVMFTMLDIWPLGYYAYRRIVLNPKPMEKKMD